MTGRFTGYNTAERFTVHRGLGSVRLTVVAFSDRASSMQRSQRTKVAVSVRKIRHTGMTDISEYFGPTVQLLIESKGVSQTHPSHHLSQYESFQLKIANNTAFTDVSGYFGDPIAQLRIESKGKFWMFAIFLVSLVNQTPNQRP